MILHSIVSSAVMRNVKVRKILQRRVRHTPRRIAPELDGKKDAVAAYAQSRLYRRGRILFLSPACRIGNVRWVAILKALALDDQSHLMSGLK